MIPRYSRQEMASVWSPENRFQKWLDIEVLVCEALARRGAIPKKAFANIRAKAAFDVARIDKIEKVVKHDVIAFLTSVGEKVGPDARFIHMGLTSSAILDTSFALLLREAADLLIADIDRMLKIDIDSFIERQKRSSSVLRRAAEIAPAPGKTRPTMIQFISGAQAATKLPSAKISRPMTITSLRPQRSEAMP